MCDSHKHDPLRQTQPYAAREIPTFITIMTMAFGKEWTSGSLDNIRVYINVLKKWIFARLFSYMTLYFPPYMKNGYKNIPDKIQFSTDEKKIFRTHTGAKDDYYRVMQRLTMAKKTSCTCDPHHVTHVLGLMSFLKITEVDGPFGAVYSILAIMIRHAPIGYTFTVTIDACLQDDFDPAKDKCVKCRVLACINNLDHLSNYSINAHSLKNVHSQVRLLKIPGKVPESGDCSKVAASSATPAQSKSCAGEPDKTDKGNRKDKARFYTDEIRENFPILYDWLKKVDKLPKEENTASGTIITFKVWHPL